MAGSNHSTEVGVGREDHAQHFVAAGKDVAVEVIAGGAEERFRAELAGGDVERMHGRGVLAAAHADVQLAVRTEGERRELAFPFAEQLEGGQLAPLVGGRVEVMDGADIAFAADGNARLALVVEHPLLHVLLWTGHFLGDWPVTVFRRSRPTGPCGSRS
jgi:hypothetical protein